MDPIINEKLNAMFVERSFYQTHDFSSLDALYAQLVRAIPGLTKDDLAAFLVSIGQVLGMGGDGELSEDALDDVAGGMSIMPLVMVGGVIFAAKGAGRKVFPAIGGALRWMKSRR